MVSLSSFHGSRLPASAPGIWRPRLPTRDREIAKRWHESHRTRDAFFPFFYLFIYFFVSVSRHFFAFSLLSLIIVSDFKQFLFFPPLSLKATSVFRSFSLLEYYSLNYIVSYLLYYIVSYFVICIFIYV